MPTKDIKEFGTLLQEGDGKIILRSTNEKSIKIAMVGDFDFHAETLVAMRKNGAAYLFENVKEELSNADLRIGNLETALVETAYSVLGPKAYLISELSAIEGIKDAGFDVITLANNHTMDAGKDALVSTLDSLKAKGILVAGAGINEKAAREAPVFRKDDFSISVHAYSYKTGDHVANANHAGCAEALVENILIDLKKAKEKSSISVVSLHMDAEFQELPAPDRIQMCRQLADAGANIVICHHPHVIQGIEIYNGSLIAYSIGNYVTPISKYMTDHTDDCHLSFQLEVEISESGINQIRIIPIELDSEGRPQIAVNEVKENIFNMLAERSNLIQNHKAVNECYRKMIREYCKSLARVFYTSMRYRNWRTIYLYWAEIKSTPTKQRWIKDYICGRYKF
jgi:poly-gamma-glutamate capsule biosynthesis protein CapA/YwtB (metallophosphatase superfamily)